MDINVENFISARNRQILGSVGLHKIAGAMLGCAELTIKEAVTQIAAKAFIKRAEERMITQGTTALAALRGETTPRSG
jgi:hypothetical protein